MLQCIKDDYQNMIKILRFISQLKKLNLLWSRDGKPRVSNILR